MDHFDTIIDALAARSESATTAYIFLTDGTSDSEIRWTFRDTAAQSRAVAAQLGDRGIGAGDRVVLAVNPGLDYVAALYATMWLGAVPVPSFPPLRRRELDRLDAIVGDCAPAAIVVDEMFAPQLGALDRRPPIIHLDGADGDHPAPAFGAPAPDDLALIQYTSGSTGAPKGVCLTHANLVSNCEALGRSMGHDPSRIGLSWLPPYHDMGLLGTIILSMYHGWPLVSMSPMHFVQRPRRWLEAITDYRVTITVGPNFSLDLCADALADGAVDDLDLSTVKELYCGAEPIRATTLQRFEELAAPLGFDARALIPCYGLAEATLFVAGKPAGSRYRTDLLPDDTGTDRAVVSCGVADSEHTVCIVDPATARPVPAGAIGEIWVSGGSVAAGYHDRDSLSDNVFRALPADADGTFLRTGDLGFLRSGELFVTGRIKDLIIVDGRNIYPQDVEAAVTRADSGIRSAVAFSMPGDGAEQLCVVAESACAQLSAERHSSMLDAIRSSVTSRVGVGPQVRICPPRTIPTTTSGKVRRQETRLRFLANDLRPVQIHPGAPAGRRP